MEELAHGQAALHDGSPNRTEGAGEYRRSLWIMVQLATCVGKL
jgi:hypothetical protein